MDGVDRVRSHRLSKLEAGRPEEKWPQNEYGWVKELDCLYRIGKKIASTRSDEIFQMMVNELREALRYPELASARMAIGGKEFKTKNYQEGDWRQSTDIAMYGQKVGSIEVNYLSRMKQVDVEPFTELEKLLLDIIAHWAWGIRENRLIEDNLRQSTSRLLTLLENLPYNIYEVDTNMKVLWTNKAPQDVGRTCYGIHFNRSQPCDGCPLAKAISSGKKQMDTMRHATKGGNSYWEVTGVPVKAGDGNVTGAIAVARNVTDRVRAEEKLQEANRLALIGQLASGIAHEINNPITGVMAFSDLLMRESVSDDVKEAVQIIHEGALRVSDIVKRLLRFARPQSRCQRCTDINAAVQAALDLQRYSLVADNIVVSTDLDPELPRTMADEAQIQEVFHNLIANARSEMKIVHNRGNLFIRTQAVGNIIRISFDDDGPGISRDHMKKLFTPFFTTRPIGEGTGLGLSICHNIISEHDGRIYAESQLGKGASFVVELPIIDCESQPTMIQETHSELAKSARLRILIVDDELIVRQSLGKVLTTKGYDVEVVATAEAAVDRLHTKDYDLIILDVKLPGLSGVELYRNLEETRPSLARRVVFITGDVIGQDTLNFFSEYKVSYLMKPFHIEDLEKAIRDITSLHS